MAMDADYTLVKKWRNGSTGNTATVMGQQTYYSGGL